MMKIAMYREIETLFNPVKDDEMAVEIVNKIIPIKDELLLKCIIKRFTIYKEITYQKKKYLNDILSEILK